jgi:molybdenum cofactor synthesis domain-containing protein
MISISEAIGIVGSEVSALDSEFVPLRKSVGRVLAEDISADLDLPPFDRSQMDGFAVKSTDTEDSPSKLTIVGESAAGRGWDGTLERGQAVRTMTGARVPKGADAVQQVELTESSGGEVVILKPVNSGKNIVKEGAEIRSGDRVFYKGEIISRQMIASLASFGYADVKTAKRPRLSILATGSEIVDVAEKPGKDQIRNSNSEMLAAFAGEFADVKVLPIAGDDPAKLTDAVTSALEDCDCLVVSGGVSVGDYDFTKPVLRAIGTEILFEKLSLKPGKPTVFGTREGKYIFGLPGNPVSMAVTFMVFVRMALLLMQAAGDAELRNGKAILTHDIKGTSGRDGLLPVKTAFLEDGRLTIESLKFSGSSNFVTFARADALVFVPADKGLKRSDVAEVFFF